MLGLFKKHKEKQDLQPDPITGIQVFYHDLPEQFDLEDISVLVRERSVSIGKITRVSGSNLVALHKIFWELDNGAKFAEVDLTINDRDIANSTRKSDDRIKLSEIICAVRDQHLLNKFKATP